MTEPVIVAIIAALASVLGNWMANKKARGEAELANALREQRQNDRLEIIEKKLDIHNGYAIKFGEVSNAMSLMAKDMEYLRKEVDSISKK